MANAVATAKRVEMAVMVAMERKAKEEVMPRDGLVERRPELVAAGEMPELVPSAETQELEAMHLN